MLKKLSYSLFFALGTSLCISAQAAQQCETFAQAKAIVSDTGYIVFIYPAGWDNYGERLCKRLIANEKIQQATADVPLLLAPIYQNRNEKTNAKIKQIMGDLNYPGDMANISYPAIVFYEKEGRQYSSIHGRELMRSTSEQVASLIKNRLEAKKKQDLLLSKSRATSDSGEKARLLLESSRVSGVDWPGGLRDAIKSVDPDDKHGYLGILNFGFSPKKDESLDEFLNRLDNVLAKKAYTPWQKQCACAATIGHIRRSLGTMAGASLITKYASIMYKLDPDSTLGVSAPVVMRDWVRQYRYGQGWSQDIIPSVPIPMPMHDVPITKPGSYKVIFKLTTGRDGIRINRLRLMDGCLCITSDDTPRDVNWGKTQQVYTFNVKKPLKNPILEITYGNEPDKRSTWGDITVICQ